VPLGTPFDFAEGESELVSGFNVEYGAVGFALIFIAECAVACIQSYVFTILSSLYLGELATTQIRSKLKRTLRKKRFQTQ
jgi:NADH:ubiquinone oxidoreductase subunit H